MMYFNTSKGFRVSKDGFDIGEVYHEYTDEEHARMFSLLTGEHLLEDETGRLIIVKASIEDVITDKLQEVLVLRKQHEYGGIIIEGQRYDTTEKDELRLNSIVAAFNEGLISSFPGWKVSEDAYIDLTPVWAKTVALLIMQHYSKCFSEESRIRTEIRALGTVQEVQDYKIIFNL